MAIAEKQDNEVEERIDNALRIRSIRLAQLEWAAHDKQGGNAPHIRDYLGQIKRSYHSRHKIRARRVEINAKRIGAEII
jgi:hypothetical protein